MKDRRGSALLIVLGFLSFMVVSAVAFSIYMRSERVPSSVFRRNVSVRHLVKAGLAHAISELDDAIRGDPYPGLHTGNSLVATKNFSNGEQHFADTWFGRVFMPPNPDDEEDNSYMAPEGETVSVLNLEGLGYVPPPLVNDVRFLSRRSWAAKWRNFDYGAGRFAYCAVNVSDYFDVNRVSADTPRSSSSRINLASMFADDFKSASEGVSDATAFKTSFINTRGDTQSTWQFVSMLDYALAMRNGAGGFESPFYKWIGKTSSGAMYDGNDDDAKDQVFVTDSWMPDDPNDLNRADAIVDLNDRTESNKGGQPFPQQNFMKGGMTFEQTTMAASDFLFRAVKGRTPNGDGGKNVIMSPVDYATLYDYLDRDDEPVSLAMPCTERVPMIAAVGVQGLSVQIKLTPTGDPEKKTEVLGDKTVTTEITHYAMDANSIIPGNLATAIVFPFKRGSELNGTFNAKALLRVFLVEGSALGLRIKRKEDGSLPPLTNLRPTSDEEWMNDSAFFLKDMPGNVPPFVLSYVSVGTTPVKLNKYIKKQTDSLCGDDTVSFGFNPQKNSAAISSAFVFSKKVETTTTVDPVTQSAKTEDPVTYYKLGISPFKADGTLVETVADHWIKSDEFANDGMPGSMNFKVHAAVWVYVENDIGNVVDLVPAVAQDDQVLNGKNNDMVATLGYDGYNSGGTPLLRFKMEDEGVSFTPASDIPLNINAVNWTPNSYYAVDPRFNWAPEDWIPRNGDVTGTKWLDWVTGHEGTETDKLLATDGRDSDIFMFVSNQGFLQSMGEFAFLPRVTDLQNMDKEGTTSPAELLAKAGSYNGNEHKIDASWEDIPNAACVWRTYRPYDSAGEDNSDCLMRLRNFYGSDSDYCSAFKNVGAKGPRVNPYTDSDSILMAAFAYTPYDWWAAAGTNTLWTAQNPKDSVGARNSRFGTLSSSRQYTFHENSTEAKIKDEDIRAIARTIRNEIRGKPEYDWRDVYDGLNWYGNISDPGDEELFKDFLGVNLDEPLHSVDRKFLYAYWRDCFANRQQLFLVFVRAESMALGGSGGGQIPPQQGGRAVALVWRDPKAPGGGNDTGSANSRKPHRTRLLFFHQFD